MSKIKKKQILWWIITGIIMIIIFWFSAQNNTNSSELSMGVQGRLATVLRFFGLEWLTQIEGFHRFLRKCAHAVAYFTLGISTANATGNTKWKRAALWAWVICVLYAVSDEVHQAFVPGRGPLVSDVCLDSISAAVGIALYVFVKKRKTCKNNTTK